MKVKTLICLALDILYQRTTYPFYWHSVLGEVTYFKQPNVDDNARLFVRALIQIEAESKHTIREIKHIQIDRKGNVSVLPDDWDLIMLHSHAFDPTESPSVVEELPRDLWRQTYESTTRALLTQTRLKVEKLLSARMHFLGISLLQ